MRQIQFPVTVDIHGNLLDNTGEIVARPVEGYEDGIREIFKEIALLDVDGIAEIVIA